MSEKKTIPSSNSTGSSNIDTSRLGRFQRATSSMVATNNSAYEGEWGSRFRTARTKEYTPEEIDRIVSSGSLREQIRLSRNYFDRDGFYKRILLYYATLYKYTGILVPNPSFGKDLSTDYIKKRYHNAVAFLDKISIVEFCTNSALKAVRDGCYYGVIKSIDKDGMSILDLPSSYCTSRFKDKKGNDLIEFDVTFFDTIFDQDQKEITLEAYPEAIRNWYLAYKDGRENSKWVFVPAEIGICFPFCEGAPFFLNVIPATINYDSAVELEKERDKEEIKKIVVQKIPHTQDGRLVFEPEEAEEMHLGSVQMLKSNKNVSVLTTYADVEAITSKTSSDAVSNNLEKMMSNVFYEAGVSSQLFASTGNLALDTSVKNDMALMNGLISKFSQFITNTINRIYANSNVSFTYTILPITHYNSKDYIDNAFKLAGGGYSLLLPAMAMGLSQRELGNLKDLENDVLKLGDKLIPLSSAYNQKEGQNRPGAPEKPLEEKSEKTIKNQESIDRQGGSE